MKIHFEDFEKQFFSSFYFAIESKNRDRKLYITRQDNMLRHHEFAYIVQLNCITYTFFTEREWNRGTKRIFSSSWLIELIRSERSEEITGVEIRAKYILHLNNCFLASPTANSVYSKVVYCSWTGSLRETSNRTGGEGGERVGHTLLLEMCVREWRWRDALKPIVPIDKTGRARGKKRR